MATDDVPRSPTPDDTAYQEQVRRADLWEAGADERERLADERERLATERERLADERERLADQHEWALDRQVQSRPARDSDEAADQEEARAAIQRAEAAVERAEADLLRAQEGARRVAARSAQRDAAGDRDIAAEWLQATGAVDDRAWLADRRDFVAAERELLADQRDRLADQRDDVADGRERQADKRERVALARERLMEARRAGPAAVSDQRLEDHAKRRAGQEQQRQAAATMRRRSAKDRTRLAADWGPSTYGPMLMASFADLAQELFSAERPDEFLQQVLKFTVGAVPGCDYASVMLWRDAHLVETAASHPIAAELDEIQFGTGTGPTTEALHGADPVFVPNLGTASEWPVLAAAAREHDVASVLSHGLFLSRPVGWVSQGAFTLYGKAQDAFGIEGQEFVSVIAAYLSVAVAMAQRRNDLDRREAALHRALSTRDVIGQAKGILMERQRLTAGEAFDLLRRASQSLNLKLADVAVQLADTGELPA
jgi:ANTAR domain